MSRFLQWLRTDQGRAITALAYVPLLLTVLEYGYLPTRIEARLRALPDGWLTAPSLEAGVTWAGACFAGYLVIPLLLTIFVHRQHPSAVGWSVRRLGRHVWVYLALYLVMVPLIWWAAQREGFVRTYPFVGNATQNLETFVRWELAYLAQFAALEAFFRGYLLFELAARFGSRAAIFMAAVPYMMIHYHKPPLEAFGAYPAGLLMGWLALRYGSWYGGALLHGLVALSMDSLAAHRAGLF